MIEDGSTVRDHVGERQTPLHLKAVEEDREESGGVRPVGLEPTRFRLEGGKRSEETTGKSSLSPTGTESDALPDAQAPTDPDLSRVITAWPNLPEPIRRAVLALVTPSTPAGAELPG